MKKFNRKQFVDNRILLDWSGAKPFLELYSSGSSRQFDQKYGQAFSKDLYSVLFVFVAATEMQDLHAFWTTDLSNRKDIDPDVYEVRINEKYALRFSVIDNVVQFLDICPKK